MSSQGMAVLIYRLRLKCNNPLVYNLNIKQSLYLQPKWLLENLIFAKWNNRMGPEARSEFLWWFRGHQKQGE